MGATFHKLASYFPKKEETRILMLGLDAAGKTIFISLLPSIRLSIFFLLIIQGKLQFSIP